MPINISYWIRKQNSALFEKAHIDGDIVCYRCAAATENDDVNIACWQTGEMIRRILHETNAVGYNIFLTGANNFRYDIYPDYKANRKDMKRPLHLEAVREYLVTYWNAKVTDGYEADDAMGIEQCLEPEGSIICSIDKDMLMIPGWHYNFVKQEQRMVSPQDGMRHLYWQALMGDKSDNIPGFDGLMRQKIPQKLQWMFDLLDTLTEEKDMYEFVREHHTASVPLDICLKCLWIWRKEGDIWNGPTQGLEPSLSVD